MALFGPSGQPVTSQPVHETASGTDAHIKDSDVAHFARDVLETSREVPVILDMWAPWCGPCKTLGPLLEAAVKAAKGAVKLVKVNIDENPEIAQQLRVQSIPTVYAFKDGQPVDGFMGAIPESQVRAFVAHLVEDADRTGHGGAEHAAQLLEIGARALAAGDIASAAQAYGHVLQDEPGHPKAVAGLARAYLQGQDLERAKTTLQLVHPEGAEDESIRAVEAEIKLRESASRQSSDINQLRSRLQTDPKDHQARFDLAMALDKVGDREGALGELLELVRLDRNWNEQAGRKQLVTLFEAMGPTDPRTLEARRKLSSLLFS